MMRFGALLLASGWVLTAVVHAQGYTPVRPVKTLSGWQCMSLASVYGADGTNAPPVSVYDGPGPGAPRVGTGAGVIIVPYPIQHVNGRVEMLWPNGRKVWIQADELAPWHSLSNSNAVCHPTLLSNGRYGFTTSG
jgi:hypothetical protein